jgi:hypothetical protein
MRLELINIPPTTGPRSQFARDRPLAVYITICCGSGIAHTRMHAAHALANLRAQSCVDFEPHIY